MIDIITYVPDSTALVAELQEKFPDLIFEDGKFLVTKTPTVRNAQGESLALIRDDDALIEIGEQLDSLVMLGTYDDVFADPALREIYDRVYDQTPITWTDENGVEHSQPKPEKFGVFAGGEQ